MPTSDRKPRARRHTEKRSLSGLALLRAMHAAIGDAQAWEALRPAAIRSMARGNLTIEQAARMFDAFGRKPLFLPRLPPAGVIDTETTDTN